MTAAWTVLALTGGALAAWTGLMLHIARTVAHAVEHETAPVRKPGA
ncbi:hypothetical protein [Streptomyces sp. RFCAC02]|nr:hypothetical protein [Streptomyces sp. RFCAC02]